MCGSNKNKVIIEIKINNDHNIFNPLLNQVEWLS